MKRLQFFPSQELEAAILRETAKRGCSESALIQDILNEFFGIGVASVSSLERRVIDEVATYVDTLQTAILAGALNVEFDLLSASSSYSNIPMSKAGKPSSERAKMGRILNKKMLHSKDSRFKNVIQVMKDPNTPKRSTGNRAALYTIDIATLIQSQPQTDTPSDISATLNHL